MKNIRISTGSSNQALRGKMNQQQPVLRNVLAVEIGIQPSLNEIIGGKRNITAELVPINGSGFGEGCFVLLENL